MPVLQPRHQIVHVEFVYRGDSGVKLRHVFSEESAKLGHDFSVPRVVLQVDLGLDLGVREGGREGGGREGESEQNHCPSMNV